MLKKLFILSLFALMFVSFGVSNAQEFTPEDTSSTVEGSSEEFIPEDTSSTVEGDSEFVPEDTSSTVEGDSDFIPEDTSSTVEGEIITTPEVTEETSNRGGSTSGSRARGGNGGSSNVPTAPSVLGAATGPNGEALACAPYLTTFMRMGMKNDVTEVKKLQTFLNEFNNAGLPVTGFFGTLTDKAVRDLQAKYASEILTPWDKAGITTNLQPTGYVYKMTQWFVNSKKCPEAQTALPILN